MTGHTLPVDGGLMVPDLPESQTTGYCDAFPRTASYYPADLSAALSLLESGEVPGVAAGGVVHTDNLSGF
jgi:hypothetical protein